MFDLFIQLLKMLEVLYILGMYVAGSFLLCLIVVTLNNIFSKDM